MECIGHIPACTHCTKYIVHCTVYIVGGDMMGMRRDGMYRPHTSVYTLYKKYLQHLVIERQRKKTVTVKKQFLRSLGQGGAKLCGVLDSEEPSSAVSWTAGSHALRCLGQCGAKLCTVSKK